MITVFYRRVLIFVLPCIVDYFLLCVLFWLNYEMDFKFCCILLFSETANGLVKKVSLIKSNTNPNFIHM